MDGGMNEARLEGSKISGRDATDGPPRQESVSPLLRGSEPPKPWKTPSPASPALPEAVPQPIPSQGPSQLALPSWWAGVCDFTVSVVFLMKGKWCPM